MQWSINKTAESNINYIFAFAQSQSVKKTKVVTWGNEEPVILRDGENIYGDRLRTVFADDIFTLMIFNATYNDSGNYSVEVGVKPWEVVVDVVTVNVHGMFFSVFEILKESYLKGIPHIKINVDYIE